MTLAKDISLMEKQNSALMRTGQKLANYINYIKQATDEKDFERILFNMPNKEFELVHHLDWDQLVENVKQGKDLGGNKKHVH
jgi:hypothetical protein